MQWKPFAKGHHQQLLPVIDNRDHVSASTLGNPAKQYLCPSCSSCHGKCNWDGSSCGGSSRSGVCAKIVMVNIPAIIHTHILYLLQPLPTLTTTTDSSNDCHTGSCRRKRTESGNSSNRKVVKAKLQEMIVIVVLVIVI